MGKKGISSVSVPVSAPFQCTQCSPNSIPPRLEFSLQPWTETTIVHCFDHQIHGNLPLLGNRGRQILFNLMFP